MSARRPDLAGHCARAEAATAELLSQRRRLIAAASFGPVRILAGALLPLRARAAAALPAPVHDLDADALALFDAAESGQWVQARTALARARAAATAAASMGGPFTEAGGALHRYLEARNGLSGDVVEAGLALSVKDRRWLIGVAERIVTRAGETCATLRRTLRCRDTADRDLVVPRAAHATRAGVERFDRLPGRAPGLRIAMANAAS